MFASLAYMAAIQPPADGTPRKAAPPIPIGFPRCTPQTEDSIPGIPGSCSNTNSNSNSLPLVTLLQCLHRPTDIKLSHFEALRLHVIPDAPPQDIIPSPGFLPPVEQWNAIGREDLEEANQKSKKPLNNGNQSPGLQTYLERQNELSIDNTAAFRTIRRIPPPPGEQSARLGNAYEFFKNLEYFTGYWPDTSLPAKFKADPSESNDNDDDNNNNNIRECDEGFDIPRIVAPEDDTGGLGESFGGMSISPTPNTLPIFVS
jgi:hypothetical protein